MAKLRARGTAVYLVTGGVRALVAPVARELGLPLENVFSNVLTFHFDGEVLIVLPFRERRALEEEEAGQDLSHQYYWTRFELSWLSSAVGNRCDRPTPCSFFIQMLISLAG